MTDKHRQRVRADTEAIRRSRRGAGRRSLLVAAVGAGVCLLLSIVPKPQPAPEAGPLQGAETPPPAAAAPAEPRWNLLLVSAQRPLAEDFTVDLEEVPGGRVDTRIAPQLNQLLADAEGAGLQLAVCSTYRNVARQRKLYDDKVAEYQRKGYDEEGARAQAGRYVQPPGCSEHHTGLAVDFSRPGQVLTEGFAQTAEGQWLAAHAAEYGFILRYPADKEEITGIAWEPWHFRYVGAAQAQDMAAQGLCLEEVQ